MTKFSPFPILLSALVLFMGCSPKTTPKKYEFRGAWVATVKNIDWPSRAGLSSEKQQDEFRRIAAYHQDAGMNALVVQVRPSTDAMYASDIEPWSEWLTGKQGLAPETYYDPLAFMIQETHSRGMEFHAWFNPYRAIIDADTVKSDLQHITRIQPGWFVRYGDNLYFDPGIPEARAYLVNVIKDVVKRYDLDAVHFDDYFYPYRIAGVEFPDSTSFEHYGRDYESVDAWRRDNVNKLVKELNEGIKETKPWVRFGISPFGVWRNKSMDEEGSETRAGQTNYDDLFADVLLWMKKGWIDYAAPQIYWHIGFELADYSVLVDWWSKHDYDRQVYIGQSTYRIGSEISEQWKNPSEMPRHLRLNDRYPQIQGNIFYNTNSILQNKLGFTDSLRTDFYRHRAFTPPMQWIDSIPPAPTVITRSADLAKGIHLQWKKSSDLSDKYVVYRSKGNKEVDIGNPADIIAVLPSAVNFFTDEKADIRKKYTYVITVMDRLNNESTPTEPLTLKHSTK